jgi:AcrR family transcriptional regulator
MDFSTAPPKAATNRGENARSAILEAAWKLYITKGYASTSLRDIAKAAGGRAVGGIYNHFESKEQIFRELLRIHAPAAAIERVFAESFTGDTAAERLRNFLARILPFTHHHYEYIKLVQIDIREFQGQAIMQTFPGLMTPMVEVAAFIQQAPGLKPMPPVVMLRLIEAVIAGYMVTARYTPEDHRASLSEERWIEIFIAAFLDGVAAAHF